MKLLYLVHRLPYPPNKGDKVRSFHLLKHLAQQHEVHLGSFIDDPEDERHRDAYTAALKPFVKSLCLPPLSPKRARVRSLRGLLSGEPLSLPYYAQADLHQWVRELVQREGIEGVLVFSSSMAQYAPPDLPMWVDFVDLDSAKWRDYAPQHAWPMSWVYAREGRTLQAYERKLADAAVASFFVTPNECDLFLAGAPNFAGRVQALRNGVDAEFYTPAADRPSPFEPGAVPLVFTGAMDYWPNVDAVTWFAQTMLPLLRQRWPQAQFWVVGRSPTPEVLALRELGVQVTGTVPDVRPYLQHARVVVAPLRLARGVQNKVLEAMAMGRPVVTAQPCAAAIQAALGDELLAADTEAEYIAHIDGLLSDPARAEAMGVAARANVLRTSAWPAQLAPLDAALRLGKPAAHATSTTLPQP
jgi:polysaccharide biosynthesis protein PslH